MDETRIIKANNAFSVDLYARLKESEKNLFFSPFSIFIAISMVYAGARGLTETQIKETLHISQDQRNFYMEFKKLLGIFYSERTSELNIANLLCIERGYELLETFLYIVDDNFKGAIWELDFKSEVETCAKINSWVAEQTKGKIKNIIEAIEEKMGLILVNAIYFKGLWDSPFKEKDTKDEPFTLISGKEVDVPMMHQTDKFRFIEEENYQILEMPYKGIRISGVIERISMVIFLPKKNDSLEELENVLTIEQIVNHLSRLQKLSERNIKITFPQFKIETKYQLSKALYDLGIVEAFRDSSDFSGIAKNPPKRISKFIHKAFVDVNEKGTEAAAVTAIRLLGASLGPKLEPPEFRADHPFLFLLIDSQTGAILFIGRVMNPQ